MGWTCTDKPSRLTIREFLQQESLGENNQILEFSHKGKVAYAAVKTLSTGIVWGCVWLIDNKGDDMYNFCWKTMDDTMGPGEDDCPEKILKLLSPTDNLYANEWRSRCREKRLNRSKNKVNHGDTIRFERAIEFTNGDKLNTFVVEKEGRTIRFLHPHSKRRYQISGWKDRAFSITPKEQLATV